MRCAERLSFISIVWYERLLRIVSLSSGRRTEIRSEEVNKRSYLNNGAACVFQSTCVFACVYVLLLLIWLWVYNTLLWHQILHFSDSTRNACLLLLCMYTVYNVLIPVYLHISVSFVHPSANACILPTSLLRLGYDKTSIFSWTTTNWIQDSYS